MFCLNNSLKQIGFKKFWLNLICFWRWETDPKKIRLANVKTIFLSKIYFVKVIRTEIDKFWNWWLKQKIENYLSNKMAFRNVDFSFPSLIVFETAPIYVGKISHKLEKNSFLMSVNRSSGSVNLLKKFNNSLLNNRQFFTSIAMHKIILWIAWWLRDV